MTLKERNDLKIYLQTLACPKGLYGLSCDVRHLVEQNTAKLAAVHELIELGIVPGDMMQHVTAALIGLTRVRSDYFQKVGMYVGNTDRQYKGMEK